MEDGAIVELYWQRSEEAIPETERKYGAYCQRIAYNVCGDHEDAEECVNDTWLRAWNRMPNERPGLLSAFLGAITRNLALDRWRARHSLKRGGGELPAVLDELAETLDSGLDTQKELEIKELNRGFDVCSISWTKPSGTCFSADTGMLPPSQKLRRKADSRKAR